MHLAKLIILILLPVLAFAMPTDSKEKLHITSNSSTYNYKTGINTFEGNVKATQGTSHITADKLITKTNGTRNIQEAIAYGLLQPAHYWTTPDKNRLPVHAHAGILKYYPMAANIAMHRDAYVTQGKNVFKGQLVLYNINQQVINVPASTRGRSILVFNPDEN